MGMDDAINEILAGFRRSLREDGGDIELIGTEDGVVRVRITGTTVPATFSTFLREYKTRQAINSGKCCIPPSTIVAVLQTKLKEKIPRIRKVEVVK